MRNILSELYYSAIEGRDDYPKISEETKKQEFEAHDALEATFTEEQEKLFADFYLRQSATLNEEQEQLYAFAFKEGFFFAMQIFNCKM